MRPKLRFVRTPGRFKHWDTIPEWPVIMKSDICQYWTRVGVTYWYVVFFTPKPVRWKIAESVRLSNQRVWFLGNPPKVVVFDEDNDPKTPPAWKRQEFHYGWKELEEYQVTSSQGLRDVLETLPERTMEMLL